MERQGDEIHVSETEASGGRKTGNIRWVLGLGIALAVCAMAIAWIAGTSAEGDVESQITASGKQDAMSGDAGDATDSIVSDRVDQVDTGTATSE